MYNWSFSDLIIVFIIFTVTRQWKVWKTALQSQIQRFIDGKTQLACDMCAKGHKLERFLAMTTNGSIQSIPANWAASTFTRSAIALPGYRYTLAARTTAPRKKPTRAALICLLHIERKMLILFDRPLWKDRSQVHQLCFYALPGDEGFCFLLHSHLFAYTVGVKH